MDGDRPSAENQGGRATAVAMLVLTVLTVLMAAAAAWQLIW